LNEHVENDEVIHCKVKLLKVWQHSQSLIKAKSRDCSPIYPYIYIYIYSVHTVKSVTISPQRLVCTLLSPTHPGRQSLCWCLPHPGAHSYGRVAYHLLLVPLLTLKMLIPALKRCSCRGQCPRATPH
jgi:hypothetical protein